MDHILGKRHFPPTKTALVNSVGSINLAVNTAMSSHMKHSMCTKLTPCITRYLWNASKLREILGFAWISALLRCTTSPNSLSVASLGRRLRRHMKLEHQREIQDKIK